MSISEASYIKSHIIPNCNNLICMYKPYQYPPINPIAIEPQIALILRSYQPEYKQKLTIASWLAIKNGRVMELISL